ncbi:AtpZ/AtpI family protein [Patescibacteria group bacterium]|nr:AtpZ/AtpI family protein [Patescibacteria group bacterium]
MKAERSQKALMLLGLQFTTRIVILCLIPSVVCAFLGRWIDKHFHLAWPFATVLGLFLSLYIIYRLMLREAQRYRQFFS